MLIFILIGVSVIGGTAYYFKVIRLKKKPKNDDEDEGIDDYEEDSDDEDEYINDTDDSGDSDEKE